MNKDKNDDDGNKGTYPPEITYGMTLLCQVVNLRMDRRKKFPLQATGHCPIPRDCSAVYPAFSFKVIGITQKGRR